MQMERFLPSTSADAEVNEHETHESEEEDTDNEKAKESKNKKKKLYYHKFNNEWCKQFSWLKKGTQNSAFCTCCCKTLSGTGSIHHIKRHELSEKHKQNFKKALRTPKISSLLHNKEKITHYQNVTKGELKMVMFLHEHNLPFLLMDHLPKLIKSVCPDSAIARDFNISRTKATVMTNTCLAENSIEIFKNQLGNSFYSLIIDETTDCSVKKTLAVVIRFCLHNEPKDRFLGLLEIEKGTSECILNSVLKLLNDCNIPINNMIGFAGDNASVLMGKKSGVQARLKQINENIFILGCTCHSLHLCSSAACLKLPKSVEEFVRNLYNHFSNSPSRTCVFEEFQKFLLLKPHKIIKPAQTRWLSLQSVVERILLLWDSLKMYFTNYVFENKDFLHCDDAILNNLKNPIYKLYLLFLSYVLQTVNEMNLQFQSENTQIINLHSKFTSLYKSILKNFIKRSVIEKIDINKISLNNPDNYIDLSEMYIGANAAIFLRENLELLDKSEIKKLKLNILAFYIELCTQIKNRFNFNDSFLIFLTNFKPNIAMSGTVLSIIDSNKYFKNVVSDLQNLDIEWRMLADTSNLKQYANLPFNEFWAKVFETKNDLNEEMFPNLNNLIKAVMCLPHSSACVERIFSKLYLIKSDLRNRLNVQTCNAIMLASELLNNEQCFTWQPSDDLMKKKPKY